MDDSSMPLQCDGACAPALLRTVYEKRQIEVGVEGLGLYRYADWLPIRRTLEGSSAPVTYRSTGLANELGLDNLFIVFSGYWPERGAGMRSGTFKECEAFSVCARIPAGHDEILVVASAGNTARAFARVCSANGISLAVVVPERNLPSIWCDGACDPCVRLIAAGGDSDYFDAIQLSSIVAKLDGFMPEGGAKNVARRDGMGTTVLSAVTTIGSIPDYYFQAVGSGTGAVAAWEANLRLIQDGRFGTNTMKLMVSQNAPFLLIHESWKAGSRRLVPLDADLARAQAGEMYATVLSNRHPPYGIIGGLYDALVATGGDTIAVDNGEAYEAEELFARTEGIDTTPAASVAVASLVKTVRRGTIDRRASILLNVTGGGVAGIRRDFGLSLIEPAAVIPREMIGEDYVREVMRGLF